MTTPSSALKAELLLYGIRRDLVALLGRIDDEAIRAPRHLRPHLETLARELREPVAAILVPLCEGRQPPGEPRYPTDDPMAREEMLDRLVGI